MYYAKDFRLAARNALSGKWALALGVTLLASLLGGVSSSRGVNFYFKFKPDSFSKLANYDNLKDFIIPLLPLLIGIISLISLYSLATFFIGGAVRLGYCRFKLNLLYGYKASCNDLFSCFDNFGKAFVLNLLVTIYTILWTLLLIIPGIIARLSYTMAPYILLENPNMSASDAIRMSKQMMAGYKGRLFCLHLSFFGWAMLCILSCGIGFLWLSPYMETSDAAFYLEVSQPYRQYYGVPAEPAPPVVY